LDGSDRFLQQAINQYWQEGIVLAIAASAKLAHLPWELLHDGNNFLVARMPAVVPVRWVSSDTKKLSIEGEPANRALNVLFMATSPLGVEPVLDFEAEEGRILEATARQPLALVVEESGCLTDLGYLIDDYGKGYFDVLHLTGHATLTDDGPRFNTETETGELYRASAADIAEKLQFRLPQVIFLSGVLIHGMGGLGKSSLAARLCDRLPEFELVFWGGRVDEPSLVSKLAAALDSRELREELQDDKEELKFRLRRVFRLLKDPPNPPFISPFAHLDNSVARAAAT
jgi:hypothetical protein